MPLQHYCIFLGSFCGKVTENHTVHAWKGEEENTLMLHMLFFLVIMLCHACITFLSDSHLIPSVPMHAMPCQSLLSIHTLPLLIHIELCTHLQLLHHHHHRSACIPLPSRFSLPSLCPFREDGVAEERRRVGESVRTWHHHEKHREKEKMNLSIQEQLMSHTVNEYNRQVLSSSDT